MNTVMTKTNKKHKNQIKLQNEYQNEHKKLCTKKMYNPLVN